jgi:DNA-binding MarR family transcriptional regulator
MGQEARHDKSGQSGSDFWGFVERARERLSRDFGVDDVLPTELLLSLNRASGTISYDLEATSHRPFGRSWATFRLMYVLWLVGPCESKDLASAAGMSRAAVSNLTGPLEKAGIVRRRPNELDGRSVVLELTEAGQRETAEAYTIQHRREREWASSLTNGEQSELIRLLGKLMDSTNVTDVRARH